jgi:PhnB protein
MACCPKGNVFLTCLVTRLIRGLCFRPVWSICFCMPRGWNSMPTQISPMLAVSGGKAAMAFYQAALGAELLWHLKGGHVVAGLSIEGARFSLAHESPPHRTRGPASVSFTTVRIELFVDDPQRCIRQALAAGAIERNPVMEHQHETIGPKPIKKHAPGCTRRSVRS